MASATYNAITSAAGRAWSALTGSTHTPELATEDPEAHLSTLELDAAIESATKKLLPHVKEFIAKVR